MPTKRPEERYDIDPVDGGRREIVGSWVQEKHLRLRHYVDISRAARRKFDRNSTFIDLYCGPGRAVVKDTGEVIPGSAIAACAEAARYTSFGTIHIADLDAINVSACLDRLNREGLGPISTYTGKAEETARQVVSKLSPSGLHFAFLDPYSVQALPFEVIQTLAELPKMDLLIHFSTMDMQRNVKQLMSNGKLDLFAPGWRDHVDPAVRNDVAVLAVFRHWCGLIKKLGYQDVSDNVELVSGSKNQPLYWLVLASKSTLGQDFWGKVSNVTAQHRFNF
ncbi:three-Cys-motif partner protein TcmP [Stenotrophomonas maltophilia]|uniref:three-Cys-motif partner protein TcmP n=1 Tax=Stenotrophomonas maltophilia TaxID=40324 RepID=UPI00313E3E17